jgi:ATP phosphoribosyltransferase regulatory subunit HisZ
VDHQPGLVDALFEVGKERQQILSNLRSAFEKKDLESVLLFVGQLVGLDKKLEGPSEESH